MKQLSENSGFGAVNNAVSGVNSNINAGFNQIGNNLNSITNGLFTTAMSTQEGVNSAFNRDYVKIIMYGLQSRGINHQDQWRQQGRC
jgi:hypothetical protein